MSARVRRVPGFFVGDFDDVIAELRLDDVADLPWLQREGDRVELGHHPAAREEVEVAAVFRAAFVFRVLFCELSEIGAGLCLFQNLVSLRFHGRVVLALRLEQDMAGAHLIGGRVLVDVVVVRALDIGRRHDDFRAHRFNIDQ